MLKRIGLGFTMVPGTSHSPGLIFGATMATSAAAPEPGTGGGRRERAARRSRRRAGVGSKGLTACLSTAQPPCPLTRPTPQSREAPKGHLSAVEARPPARCARETCRHGSGTGRGNAAVPDGSHVRSPGPALFPTLCQRGALPRPALSAPLIACPALRHPGIGGTQRRIGHDLHFVPVQFGKGEEQRHILPAVQRFE